MSFLVFISEFMRHCQIHIIRFSYIFIENYYYLFKKTGWMKSILTFRQVYLTMLILLAIALATAQNWSFLQLIINRLNKPVKSQAIFVLYSVFVETHKIRAKFYLKILFLCFIIFPSTNRTSANCSCVIFFCFW